jgi:hypothetical protein
VIIEELYDALIEAGASEDKARAATRFTQMDNRFSLRDNQIDKRLVEMDNRIDRRLAAMDHRIDYRPSFSQVDPFPHLVRSLALLKWMVGLNLALTIAILFRLLS